MKQSRLATRRQFLGTSAGIVAGAAATQFATHAVRAAGSDVVTVALIGCGGRGTGATANALSTSGGAVQLVAMADAFRANLDNSHNNLRHRFEDKMNVPEERKFVGFDAYKQVIDLRPDVVVLATPPGFRPQHFEYAVQNNCHVFMEKPVAVDAPGVRRVVAAAQEAKRKNLKVAVGLQRHHDLAYLETIERLRDGAIGDINLLRAYWCESGVWVRSRAQLQQAKPDLTEMEYQMHNWYYFAWLSGDHICEQHIHNLDVCNWVKDDYPAYAQGQGGRQVRTGRDHGEIYDHHAVEFTYKDGTVMLSQCRHMPNTWSHVAEYAHGPKGMATIGGQISLKDGETWRFRGQRVEPFRRDPYQAQHEALFEAIRNDQLLNQAENGAYSSMTAIMGRMATYSGQMIKWDEAINSEHALAPDNLTWNDNPPVMPDENGYYPIPTPGVTRVI